MNTTETDQAMFLLNGHWPRPAMEPPEIAVWAAHMDGWTPDEFADAIRKITLIAGRAPFRPVPSEVAQLVATRRRRERPTLVALPSGERRCTPAENAAALDRILARSHGDDAA